MRSTAALLALVLLAGCGATRGAPDRAGGATPLTAAAAYALPQPEPDLLVAYGPGPRQFGELRLPDGGGPFPVAVVVHGGCWLSDYDGSYMGALAEAITDLGLASWSIAYRRVGEEGGGWPGTFLDVAEAVDHLRLLAQSQPLDAERVIAIGHSAGGHLALWLAGRASIPEHSELFDPAPLPIDGVLALAAAADLAFLAERGDCANAARLLMEGLAEEHPERYAAASPAALTPLAVPQILVNGGLDEQWSAPADRYLAAALNSGDLAERRVAPAAGHFELVVPRGATWPVVRRALIELTERAGWAGAE
jgi:acetyl esterase/lipase